MQKYYCTQNSDMMKFHNLRKSIGVNCSSRRRASDIFHPTRTHWFKICILKFFCYHCIDKWLYYLVEENLTFLWASFGKWPCLWVAMMINLDLSRTHQWISHQPELYLPQLISTKLSFFWGTLYNRYLLYKISLHNDDWWMSLHQQTGNAMW